MDITKLTICRQDVIVVSDTEAQPKRMCSRKRKKLKKKVECVRKVQITTVTVNRPIPYCYRHRCQRGEYHQRQTSQNTKYRKRPASPAANVNRLNKRTPPEKTIQCKNTHETSYTRQYHETSRDLYSPITVKSSSDMFENISSNSFDSDADKFEELIKSTRQRLKSENLKWPPTSTNSYQNISSDEESLVRFLESMDTLPITKEDNQNISPCEESSDVSLHSMETVILEINKSIASPRRVECLNENNTIQDDNNDVVPMILCNSPDSDNFVNQKKTSPLRDGNGNLSPLYEISGKVFMEHYLNNSVI